MSRIFLCILILTLFTLAFAENVTTTEPPVEISTTVAEVIVRTTESSPTTTTSDAIEGTITDSSPTKSDVINSTTTEKSSAVPDKPYENLPSKIPSFQYFALPFIPLNGLVQNFSGQYGVLPPVSSGIFNSVSQQSDRKQVEEPEREPKVQSVIESPAPGALPEFLQGINSMQKLTEMVLGEMLNQQRGDGTCGGFIELVDQAELSHAISWGLPPADVESCSWVIWARRGGPIEIEFPEDANSVKFHHSRSSLWILNVNESLGYRKTLLTPGDVKTFATNFDGSKGYYPFVIVHMLDGDKIALSLELHNIPMKS